MSYVRPHFFNVLRGLAALALACFWSLSHAQAAPASPAFAFRSSPVGGGTVRVGPAGSPLKLVHSAPSITASSGSVAVARDLALKTPSGSSLTVAASGLLSRQALARILSAGMRGSVYLGVGVALWEVAKSIGWVVSKDADGNLVYMREDSSICTAAPCYEYLIGSGMNGAVWYPSISALAYGVLGRPDGCTGSFTYRSAVVEIHASAVTFEYRYCGNDAFYMNYTDTPNYRSVPPSPPGTLVPGTQSDFISDVQSQGVSSPFISDAVSDAMLIAPDSASVSDLSNITVTGPATTPVRTTTTTNPDGTTTTTRVEDRHTYAGPDVTTTIVTTTETYNPVTNVTNTTTDTTVIESPAETPDPCAGDSAGTLGCMEPGEAPEQEDLENKDLDFNIAPVSFASNASCPSGFNFSFSGRSYSISYGPICDFMVYLKAFVLLACSLIAAFIVADGFKV